MGYYSYVSGDAIIEPAIPETKWPEAEESYGTKAYFGYFTFEVVPGDETVSLVDGQVKVIGTSSGHIKVGFAYDDSIKGYDLEDHAQALFDWVQANGAEIKGIFNRKGEEDGDYQRYRYEGTAYYNEAGAVRIVWPTGDEERI